MVRSCYWDEIGNRRGLSEVPISGVVRSLCAVSNAGLVKDIADVATNGIQADHQLIGDLLVAAADGKQTQNLDLPG